MQSYSSNNAPNCNFLNFFYNVLWWLKMNRVDLHNSIINNSQLSFSRSGGKGGQNVNKVNTKVRLVLPLELLEGINENERNRLKSKLSSIINKDFCLFLDVDEERYQERNRQIALARIENRIIQALAIQKKRIKTDLIILSNQFSFLFQYII